MSSLLPLFRWFDSLWVGRAINDSIWLFPAIEAVHILALALLCGAIVILNLRLFGLTLPGKPVRQIAEELAPWVLVSLVTILASGLLLFSSEAMKAYGNVPFQVKMILLFAAVTFHYTVYRKVIYGDELEVRPVWSKLAAAVSLMLWFSVGLGGRAIGFL
jgi:hypothetical protein